MHLYYRNVNDAFTEICKGFQVGSFETKAFDGLRSRHMYLAPPMSVCPSRYGEVIRINEPVTITYTSPLERCLLNFYRDVNPFFHLIEALWCLAGKNEISYLEHFNSRVNEFSDDGETWWGAYGYRWKHFFPHPDYSESASPERCQDPKNPPRFLGLPCDQISTAIEILRKERNGRRVVLAMWSPEDLYRVMEMPDCKDVPCNLDCILQPRDEYLDLSVINRSNDMIWGALGSNYVTFSMLLEYMALASGYKPGHYHQITTNLHVYRSDVSNHFPGDDKPHYSWSEKFDPARLIKDGQLGDPYAKKLWAPMPLFQLQDDVELFDTDCEFLFRDPLVIRAQNLATVNFGTQFFQRVVAPMISAWNHHKKKDYKKALAHCLEIRASDWQIACGSWMERRAYKHQERA